MIAPRTEDFGSPWKLAKHASSRASAYALQGHPPIGTSVAPAIVLRVTQTAKVRRLERGDVYLLGDVLICKCPGGSADRRRVVALVLTKAGWMLPTGLPTSGPACQQRSVPIKSARVPSARGLRSCCPLHEGFFFCLLAWFNGSGLVRR